MKAIHYDTEGDILSVTFAEADGRNHTGIELSDNIVLYLDTNTDSPYQLVLVSYQVMVQPAHAHRLRLMDWIGRQPCCAQRSLTCCSVSL